MGIARALLALIALCTLRVWHLLLVRLLRGGPPDTGWWLAAVFVLVVVGRATARRSPAGSASWLTRRWAALDGPALSMLAFVLLLVWCFDVGFERAASDGREYFVQVRSLVIDRDLDFANETAVFGVRGTADVYAFGAALLWAPFFLAAHAWLGVLNLFGAGFALDGYSNAYQRAVGFGTLVYGAAGLVLIFRTVSAYYARTLAALATVVLTAGSFLIWYLTVDNSMVHGVSMFATTLFLYAWHRTGSAPSARRWMGLGAAAALMALVRWQNALFAVVPFALSLWSVARRPGTADSPSGVREALRGLAYAAVAGALTFVPQLVFWKVARGGWFAVPAAEHGVRLFELHIADVLFSPNHGLLSTSPLLYLALPGLVLFVRRDGRLATALVAGLAAQVYINSAVEVWWGGAGFGARRFDNSALVFAAGLAAMFDWARRRPLVAPSAIAAAFVFLNAAVALDVKRGRLPATEAMTFEAMLDSAYARAGNPFSFPMNAWVAWRYGGGPTLYDRLRGRTYNNLLIDLGEAGDELFLTEGWLARERAPDVSFRWSAGPRAALVVPLKAPPVAYQLDLRCAPFAFPGAPEQTMEVVVNGRSVRSLRLAPGWSEPQVSLDAETMHASLTRIELRYGYSRSPRDAGTGDDPRTLAVQCDWIRLTRK